jgi:hypothetical protein
MSKSQIVLGLVPSKLQLLAALGVVGRDGRRFGLFSLRGYVDVSWRRRFRRR